MSANIPHPRALEIETVGSRLIEEGFGEEIAQADIGTDWDKLAALGTRLSEQILANFDVQGDLELEHEVHRVAYRLVEEHYQSINPSAPDL
jgi:hypothetical protein